MLFWPHCPAKSEQFTSHRCMEVQFLSTLANTFIIRSLVLCHSSWWKYYFDVVSNCLSVVLIQHGLSRKNSSGLPDHLLIIIISAAFLVSFFLCLGAKLRQTLKKKIFFWGKNIAYIMSRLHIKKKKKSISFSLPHLSSLFLGCHSFLSIPSTRGPHTSQRHEHSVFLSFFPNKVLQELLAYFLGGIWKLFLLNKSAVESQFCEGWAFHYCNPSPKIVPDTHRHSTALFMCMYA